MTIRTLAAAALAALALAACGEDQGNTSNTAAINPAETGDLNSAISGDELSPIPEAEDDLAANMSENGNLSAPPPPTPGSNTAG